MSVRVGILGATGYTALELMKILLRHPSAEITVLTSRQSDRPHVSQVHHQLAGRLDLHLESRDVRDVASQVDCVFSCLPHGASASHIADILNEDIRIVDFSADYRLRDAETYERWYGLAHPDPDRLGKVVYGLPELFEKDIRPARLVANPGCYTSTAILGLAPLICRQLIDPEDIIVDAKSGVSGAGRSPKLTTHFPECNESIVAYAVGSHRHTPEIEQILSLAGSQSVSVTFTPHLTPMDRGILCTMYTRPSTAVDASDVMDVYREFYDGRPFVRIVDHLPATKHVVGTNYCDITVRTVGERLLVLSCTDNLIKGAAGVAVQNFNLMFGFEETTALVV